MKRNPTVPIGKHPDLFDGESSVVIDWREAPRKKLLKLALEDFSEADLDEIHEEDENLYRVLEENSEKAQEARISDFVSLVRDHAAWRAEYEKKTSENEWVIDFLISRLHGWGPELILEEIGDDRLSEIFETVDYDSATEILRDPDMYDISTDSAPDHEVYRYPVDQLQDCIDGYKYFDDVREAVQGWTEEDLAAAKKELENNEPWIYLAADEIKDLEGQFCFTFSVDIEFMFFAKVDEMREAMEELEIKEEGPGEPETDDVVYEFPDGFYIANLRPAQLPLEGRKMGMCVGRKDMGYIEGVKEGSIKIFSLRSPSGKPKLTIEYSVEDGDIEQIKGNGNRLPGFPRGENFSRVKRPDEVRKMVEFINKYVRTLWPADDLPVRYQADDVKDLKPALEAMGYFYNEEGEVELYPEGMKWRVIPQGHHSYIEELVSSGEIDLTPTFNSRWEAAERVRELRQQFRNASTLGPYINFTLEPIHVRKRENPERSIMVPPHAQMLAKEAYSEPWGGEW